MSDEVSTGLSWVRSNVIGAVEVGLMCSCEIQLRSSPGGAMSYLKRLGLRYPALVMFNVE